MTLKYPVNYIAITQYFKKGVHNGLDLGWSNLHGGMNQPIYAPADGVVVNVRSDYNKTDTSGGSYGNYVKIKHNDSVSTLCAHMKYGSVKLKIGDTVKQGEQIGVMGATGHAIGNHVHYEVFLNNTKVNPEEYTYVYPGQITSSDPNAIKGLLYYTPVPTPTPDPTIEPKPEPTLEPTPEPVPDPKDKIIENLQKQIQEQNDKINLQAKEIAALKEQINEDENYKFTYKVLTTSLYEIKLNEGETLLIK